MNLLEHEAKELLREYGVATPRGVVLRPGGEAPDAPVVLKSQVHSGGRGKLGGVQVVKNQSQMAKKLAKIWKLAIKGEKPEAVLAEEVLEIDREMYLALMIDRSSGTIQLVAHPEGGIGVEAHQPSEFLRQTLHGRNSSEIGELVSEFYDLPGQSFILQDYVERLYGLVVASDAILCEINPLVLTTDGRLVAADAKITLDSDASYRHPEWASYQKVTTSSNFVTLNPDGEIATIANGAGLAMATVDAVVASSLVPANFLDIGGGASVESIVASFAQIAEFPRVRAIIINIFGGIVRCDDVASAILAARQQFPTLPPLYIRLAGNRAPEAATLLKSHDLTLYDSLAQALQEVVRREVRI